MIGIKGLEIHITFLKIILKVPLNKKNLRTRTKSVSEIKKLYNTCFSSPSPKFGSDSK
jgi:hypothetical protein